VPEQAVRSVLPQLDAAEAADLVRVVTTLSHAFAPERIYVFGSQARRSPSPDSDVDLLVVLPGKAKHPHRLAQDAFRRIGPHALPLDLVFMGREEFDWRAEVVTSLPATVLREGHLLFAADAAG